MTDAEKRRAVISLLVRWCCATEDSADEGIQQLRKEIDEAVKALRGEKKKAKK